MMIEEWPALNTQENNIININSIDTQTHVTNIIERKQFNDSKIITEAFDPTIINEPVNIVPLINIEVIKPHMIHTKT